MAQQTVTPKAALEIIKEIYPLTEDLMTKIENTNKKIKEMAKGDGTTAYWSGRRAYSWYGLAFANIANDYQDCINVCNTVGSFAGYLVAPASKNEDQTLANQLVKYAQNFESLAKKAKNKRAKVLSNSD